MLTKNHLILSILHEGSTTISNLLLNNYQKINLSDQEMMVIIHLLYFQGKGNYFPSIIELEKRMSISTEDLMRILQRLVRNGYIVIEENREKDSGMIYEAYNLDPLFYKLIKEVERNFEVKEINKANRLNEEKSDNLFKIFEREFARPLSPIEIELISTWVDNDKYSEEIIIYALKEAVFNNKLYFRYIDKILFNWQKLNLQTIDQVKEYAKKFRNNQDHNKDPKDRDGNSKLDSSFEFYNWLENE